MCTFTCRLVLVFVQRVIDLKKQINRSIIFTFLYKYVVNQPRSIFLLKSLYHDRKVEQSYILCVRGIDFASVFDFYILIWNFLHDRGELLTLFLQFSDWIGEMVRQRGIFPYILIHLHFRYIMTFIFCRVSRTGSTDDHP